MSRRDRRAALARGKLEPTANLTELADRATLAFQESRAIDAEVLCKQILALDPRQPTALNVVGLMAAKTLAKAVAANELDAACHTISPPPTRHWVSAPTRPATTAKPSRSA
jgi:hypothetical protein